MDSPLENNTFVWPIVIVAIALLNDLIVLIIPASVSKKYAEIIICNI